MAEIISPVMQLGQWIWTPVKRGMSYMFHYKRNLQSLEDPVQKFERILNSHKESVHIADLSGDRIKPEVQTWLTDADKAMVDVAKLNGEAEAGEKCFIAWCPDLKWRYKLGKKAWNMTTEINKLVDEAKFETVTLEVQRAPEVQHLVFTAGFQAFEATKQAIDRVMNALKSGEVTTIGVYGMGGIGKTTLAKQVGAQVCKDGLFDSMIMAVFSQHPVVRQIQEQLADMLGLKLHESTDMPRAARLRKRIMTGEKILIILDDVWDTIDLSIIGIPSHDELGICGSKVILTSRIFSVCHAMGSQEKIPLNILSEEDSWNLFMKNANRSFESTDFCEVAKQVAGECGGLPIALIVVARALGDKDQLEEWQVAARRLQNSQPASVDGDERVLQCIRLSYDYLKNEYAKSCFLLCCLFPEDYNIPIEELIKYGLGKGLFGDADTFEEARSRGRSVIKYLKSSSLLLDGDWDGSVKMHDVIRDKAMSIATSEYGDKFLVRAGTNITVWPKNACEGCYAISLMENDIQKLPKKLVCPKLEILLLQDNRCIREIPETFFASMNELKVLDLSRTDISILPQSMSLLTNLRALYLDKRQSLRTVSQLGGLKKLEILSLRDTALEELPEEIGNLSKLRMLDLTRCGSMKRIPSNLISRLSMLEELHMLGSFKEWGSKVEGEGEETNVGFVELIGLSYLNILEVEMVNAKCLPVNVDSNPSWSRFIIWIEADLDIHLTCSRQLVLRRSINRLPSWFNCAVTQRAQSLWYKNCEDLNNIPEDIYDGGNLVGLESLIIDGGYQGVTLMDTTTRVPIASKPLFENLKELRVRNLKNLKELRVGELPEGSLGNLKHLRVENCRNLLNPVLPSNLLRRLQNLETLQIEGVTSAEYVFRSEDFGQEQIDLKVRNLDLKYLPQLENIWSGPSGYEIFGNLQYLDVYKCDKLKYVFTYEVSQSLLQLERIDVQNCRCLEMIIRPAGEGSTVANKIILPKLKTLELKYLPQLTSFYTGDNGIECPLLQDLTVYKCPQFPHLTYDFHSRNPVKVKLTER